MNYIKCVISLLASLFIATIISIEANAVTIGISPVAISNQYLRRGSELKTDFTFSLADIAQDMQVEITFEGDLLKDWVSFSTGDSFVYLKGQKSETVSVVINVPENAEYKNYRGIIRFNAQEIEASDAVARVVSGTRVDINIDVTDKVYSNLKVSMSTIKISEDGDKIVLVARTFNQGNVVDSFDKAEVKITDLNNRKIETIEKADFEGDVDPFSTKEIAIEFDNVLSIGEYYANVNLYKDDKVVYENKLLLNVDKEGQMQESPLPEAIEIKDFIILGVGTFIGIITMLVVMKFIRKHKRKQNVVLILITFLPILALLVFYGYYGKQLYDRHNEIEEYNKQQEQSSTESNDEEYIVLNDNTIRFRKDSKVYKEISINPEVKIDVQAGSSYTIVDENSGWYKLEIAPNDYGYILIKE